MKTFFTAALVASIAFAQEDMAEPAEWTEEPSTGEQIIDGLRDKLIDAGFDPEVAEEWINETGAAWEELDQRQTAET